MATYKPLDLNDSKVWDLFCSGRTNGVFQAESRLVQHWLKQIKPRNIWELSIVIALVRPGPLDSGQADMYVSNKNNPDHMELVGHPVIDDILKTTNAVLIFQEALIALGMKLAWPQLPENEKLIKSDKLRKSVSKKNQAETLKMGGEFIEGCVTNKVDKDIADKLFDIIKKSGRYLFNLSHSILYAYNAFKTAHAKVYYPKQFFATYLTYSKFKQINKWEYLGDLIQDTRGFGYDILPPNINAKNSSFKVEGEKIRFGLNNIKYVGKNDFHLIKELPEIKDWRQLLLLRFSNKLGGKLRSNTIESLVCSGAFSDIKQSRQTLLNVIQLLDELSPKELAWVIDNIDDTPNLTDLPKLVEKCAEQVSVKKRKDIVISWAKTLDLNVYDKPAWIEVKENEYMGCAITATAVDEKDTSTFNTCLECVGDVPERTKRTLGVSIDKVMFNETKNGDKMCKITVHDSTGSLKFLPVFPELFSRCKSVLIAKNTVKMKITQGKRGWFVEDICPI